MSSSLPERVEATCLFDSAGWLATWSGVQMEKYRRIEYVADGAQVLPLYTVDATPFWSGYEEQTGVGRLSDRGMIFAGSVYSMYTKLGPVSRPLVEGAYATAMRRLSDGEADVLIVPNLTPEGVDSWVTAVGEPSGRVLLDRTYHCALGNHLSVYMGQLPNKLRRDVERRRRRSGEAGLVVTMREPREAEPLLERLLGLAVGSSVQHSWPALYDLATLRRLLLVPGAIVATAEAGGELIGAFFGFRHRDELVLLTGGVDYARLPVFSTYVALMYHCLEWACAHGYRRVEWGRDNYRFKERHGMTAIDLWGLVYEAPGRSELSASLEQMHAVLAKYISESR